MRNAAFALFLGAVLTGGLATAQNVTLGDGDAFAKVTFYNGDPAEFGRVLETANLDDSAVAKRIVDNDDDTTYSDDLIRYFTLEMDGKVYTVETFAGGESKNSVYLDIDDVDLEDAMTLGELLDDIAADPSALDQLEQTRAEPSARLAQSN